jgi:adenylate kinase family enzyme
VNGSRIIVVGTTGSGKTTMARELARRFGYTHIEYDSINWTPGWTEASPEEFRRHLRSAVAGGQWVADGNYFSRGAGQIAWPQADTVVFLDLPLAVVLGRLFLRTGGRVLRRTPLWNGNVERVRNVLARDNLFVWALKTHRSNRERYAAMMEAEEWSHLTWVRLRSSREVRAWLELLDRQ